MIKSPVVSRRGLAGLFLVASCLISSGIKLHAQSPSAPKPPVIFNVVTLTGSLRDLFYDLNHKQVAVAAGPTALSFPYTAPEGGSVRFYRLAPPIPPSIEPIKVPMATVSIGNDGPYLMVFSGPLNEHMTVRVLDNSWETNPPLSSRVINASRRKTAIKLDSGMAELTPGEIHIFPPPANPSDVIELKIATLDETQWTLRMLAPQALFPYTRNIFIIKEQVATPENPNPVDLDVFSIVDSSQPPPPPKPPKNEK